MHICLALCTERDFLFLKIVEQFPHSIPVLALWYFVICFDNFFSVLNVSWQDLHLLTSTCINLRCCCRHFLLLNSFLQIKQENPSTHFELCVPKHLRLEDVLLQLLQVKYFMLPFISPECLTDCLSLFASFSQKMSPGWAVFSSLFWVAATWTGSKMSSSSSYWISLVLDETPSLPLLRFSMLGMIILTGIG